MSRIFPIIIVSIIIALILGGYFFWWPKYQEFNDKELELENKEKEIEQKEVYIRELKTLSKELTEYSDEFAKIDFALPEEPSVAALFKFLQKTSLENGVILTAHDLGAVYSLGNLGKSWTAGEPGGSEILNIPFSISISGSYSAFKNFLSAIYQNVRLIELDSISFSSPKGEGLFNFSLKLQTRAYQK